MGGFSAKMSPTAILIIKGGQTKVVNIKDQTAITKLVDMVPDVIDKVRGMKSGMISDEDAVKAAFPEPDIETVPVKEAANVKAEEAEK